MKSLNRPSSERGSSPYLPKVLTSFFSINKLSSTAKVTGAKQFFVECAAPELASEAAALLDEHEQKIRSRELDSRARKNMLYEARYYGQTSSARLYTGSREKSAFTKKQSVEEHLNEKPKTDQSNPSGEQQSNE